MKNNDNTIVLDHKARKKDLKWNKLVDDYVNYVKEYILNYKNH